MKLTKIIILFFIISSFSVILFSENAYADKTIDVEIKYSNGDRTDYNSMNILVYQDFNKEPILEKELVSNPDFISVPENHRYKIEVFANGMYADVGYIELKEKNEKITMTIPLSSGLQFEVYYKDGQTPIKDATVVIKSNDNLEWARGTTNDQGETIRYWIQSTSIREDHYIADVYLNELFLISYSPIKLLAGLSFDQKIITKIPEIVDMLISINLYDGSSIITSKNGNYNVILIDSNGNEAYHSKVNFRGDTHFSNLKSGTYVVKISSGDKDEDKLWPQSKIDIIGDLNKFNIIKNSKSLSEQINPLLSCNCISFRLDDVQDYWLSDTQIEIMNLFSEKNIPLTVGIIGNLIGDDEELITSINEKLEQSNFEIANHSWNNDLLEGLDKEIQDTFITDTHKKIKDVFNVDSTSFIPPQNRYDENTIDILKQHNYTHLISHVDENPKTIIEDDLFFKIPAITETGILIDATQWQLQDKDKIYQIILNSVEEKGYAIIMMHPQEFSLNEQGEYDIPNKESLSNLSLLLDEVSQIDTKLVKLSQVKPFSETIQNEGQEDIEIIPENTNEIESDSCNCVAFRLDDIQDYWLNDVQINIMDVFLEKQTPLTIGIIANAFGNDPKITEFVKQNVNKNMNNLEIATKGMGLTPLTSYEKTEQNNNIKESLDLIELKINVRPQILIPPDNKFNSDTLEILEGNGITHISASLINGDSPPFEFKNKKVYRFPLTASTGVFDTTNNIYEGVSSQQTLSEINQSIDNYGYSVVSLHLQEFAIINNSTYTNSINQDQLEELKNLIDEIMEKDYKIVTIGKINSNLVVLVPEWVKNNAGWWAGGSIDDKTFMQGVEYLIKEQVINVDEKSQTSETEQKIPEWVKNNAGWWADGSIDDKTFMQGIEYLVKNGIILH